MKTYTLFLSLLSISLVSSLTTMKHHLLSELPSPCLVIDLNAFQLQFGSPLPPLRLGRGSDDDHQSQTVLLPTNLATDCPHEFDSSLAPVSPRDVCFLHSTVVAGRDKAKDSSHLAKLDAPTTAPAQLVLGLNNHHVISYYWARSAGAGAAMEAIGVHYDHDTCWLRWCQGSFLESNSNDGKRSEWVAFLRPGDQVQLLPERPAELVPSLKVYGVTSRGRPLGSEPAVVCEWKEVLL